MCQTLNNYFFRQIDRKRPAILPNVVIRHSSIISYFCNKLNRMGSIKTTCFVCKTKITPATSELNPLVNLPVCKRCKGTEQEKNEAKEVLDSLANGFVCGCI
jgi:hypothetical protein